jgi:hypothetical protein
MPSHYEVTNTEEEKKTHKKEKKKTQVFRQLNKKTKNSLN